MKICKRCKIEKEESEFTKNSHYKDGLHNWCKLCHSIWAKKYRQQNYKKIYNHKKEYWIKNKEELTKKNKLYRDTNKDKLEILRLQKIYNISEKEATELYKKKNMATCACCNKKETKIFRGIPFSLAIDHNHKTGKIRGLLCSNCNRALGLMNDDIKILKNAVAYLESHD